MEKTARAFKPKDRVSYNYCEQNGPEDFRGWREQREDLFLGSDADEPPRHTAATTDHATTTTTTTTAAQERDSPLQVDGG